MSFYFREKPRFGEKLRGKSRDELMDELRQQFDEKSKSFFEPTSTRSTRDPFERHTAFSRGFPFDDVEGFGRRGSDIRSHLDDLATRHPEFADHLLGSAWGDIPAFHSTGSLRNRRRRGSGSSSSYQGHPDEDTRSQTSGSSANSAASGASGVSSNGDHKSSTVINTEKEEQPSLIKPTTTRRNPIPQYGLRNTVDIGQHRHEMDNPARTSDNRGQRSMSAPPENRQQNETSMDQTDHAIPQNQQNQRFVSRVDITPQFVPPSGTNDKSQKTQTTQQQKNQQQQSNVRHIPIFVEGRDEPVVPKNLETEHDASTWSYGKPQQSSNSPPSSKFQQPPQFPSPPPQFHRPSHFNQHYTGGRARDWLPSFDEEFYSQPGFPQSGIRRQQHPSQHSPFESQSPPRQTGQFRQQTSERPSQRPQPKQPDNQSSRTNSQPEVPVEEPRKQTQPKDPLEKVAEVQQEVDSLNEQVLLWSGKSRKDKDYMYLDEMLTRELIKLDDIETEGKEAVRQARKNAIKAIQNSISLLESKAPLNDASKNPGTMDIQQENGPVNVDNANQESMVDNEVQKIDDDKANVKTPIPLPPAPSSPIKEPISQPEVDVTMKGTTLEVNNDVVLNSASQEIATTEMEQTPVTKVPSQGSMDTQTEIVKNEEPTSGEATETLGADNSASSRTAKKIRKTKKKQPGPICDNAIPLPGPEIH